MMRFAAIGNPQYTALYEGPMSKPVDGATIDFNPPAGPGYDGVILLGGLNKDYWTSFLPVSSIISLTAGVDHLVSLDLPDTTTIYRLNDAGMVPRMFEYVLYATIHYQRGFDVYRRHQEAHLWEHAPFKLAEEMRIGILGAGVMGMGVARQLKALGYQVKCWARTSREDLDIPVLSGEAGLNDLLASTDVLVCLLPLTPQTTDFVDRDKLSRLPRGSVFVSCGRGAQVVDQDLVDLLDEGHLRGAFIDVGRGKPRPPEHIFWAHPKIVLTPHIAADSEAGLATEQAFEIIGALVKGQQPAIRVDVRSGY